MPTSSPSASHTDPESLLIDTLTKKEAARNAEDQDATSRKTCVRRVKMKASNGEAFTMACGKPAHMQQGPRWYCEQCFKDVKSKIAKSKHNYRMKRKRTGKPLQPASQGSAEVIDTTTDTLCESPVSQSADIVSKAASSQHNLAPVSTNNTPLRATSSKSATIKQASDTGEAYSPVSNSNLALSTVSNESETEASASIDATRSSNSYDPAQVQGPPKQKTTNYVREQAMTNQTEELVPIKPRSVTLEHDHAVLYPSSSDAPNLYQPCDDVSSKHAAQHTQHENANGDGQRIKPPQSVDLHDSDKSKHISSTSSNVTAKKEPDPPSTVAVAGHDHGAPNGSGSLDLLAQAAFKKTTSSAATGMSNRSPPSPTNTTATTAAFAVSPKRERPPRAVAIAQETPNEETQQTTVPTTAVGTPNNSETSMREDDVDDGSEVCTPTLHPSSTDAVDDASCHLPLATANEKSPKCVRRLKMKTERGFFSVQCGKSASAQHGPRWYCENCLQLVKHQIASSKQNYRRKKKSQPEADRRGSLNLLAQAASTESPPAHTEDTPGDGSDAIQVESESITPCNNMN